MKALVKIAAAIGILAVTACDTGSTLPDVTGKGNVRAINAIENSPDIAFFIEERLISNVGYKGVSPFSEWDDLEYNFNFDVIFAGDSSNTRIASRRLKIDADGDYTFLLTGTLTAPTLTLFESTNAVFTDGGTNLQIRFLHSAASEANLDYYFAAEGVAPVAGAAVATLGFGEIADAQSFATGDYVLTLTTAGDPTDIVFTSNVGNYAAATDLIVTPFDGDYDDSAPTVVRVFGSGGAVSILSDAAFPATVEFVQAAQDLGATDIYDDEALTSLILANHNFLDQAAEIPIQPGTNTFRFTPAGDTAAVTVEGTLLTANGLRYRMVTLGEGGTYANAAYLPDRRPIATAAKILIFHAAVNANVLDFYIVTSGTVIDGVPAFRGGILRGIENPAAGIAAGDYDLYVTEAGATEILAGTVSVTADFGDVLDIVIFDTADPAVLDIRILPLP